MALWASVKVRSDPPTPTYYTLTNGRGGTGIFLISIYVHTVSIVIYHISQSLLTQCLSCVGCNDVQ